jgi:hypothetical protein
MAASSWRFVISNPPLAVATRRPKLCRNLRRTPISKRKEHATSNTNHLI